MSAAAPQGTPSKRVVYTAVFGGYDTVSPVQPCVGCDFICFTDNPATGASGWQVRLITHSGEPPALLNRKFKMLPHQFLHGYAQSLYVDGHVVIRQCPQPLFDKYLSQGLVAIPTHQDRNCAYDEAKYCVEDGIISATLVEQQMSGYEADGFPRRFGLTENGIILRRHNDPHVIRLMEAWWQEYLNKSRRDQLSLPYLSWKQQFVITPLEEGPRRSARYFTLHPHQRHATSPVRLVAWYLRAFKHRSPLHFAAHRAYEYLSRSMRGRS